MYLYCRCRCWICCYRRFCSCWCYFICCYFNKIVYCNCYMVCFSYYIVCWSYSLTLFCWFNYFYNLLIAYCLSLISIIFYPCNSYISFYSDILNYYLFSIIYYIFLYNPNFYCLNCYYLWVMVYNKWWFYSTNLLVNS